MRINKSLLALCLLTLSFRLEAQTIPPACAQYIDAFEACYQNAVDYYSRTDIDMAEKAKKKLAENREFRKLIKLGVQKKGERAVAEYCTSKDFINISITEITNITVLLNFANALDRNCARKMTDVRVPNYLK